jgi:hypothetical protein
VHASWVNRGESGLSLYQAAEFDTRDSLLIDAEIKEILTTTKGKGSGPSLSNLSKRRDKQAIDGATRSGHDLIDFGVRTSKSSNKRKDFEREVMGSVVSKRKKTSDPEKLYINRLNAHRKLSMS